MRSPFNILHSAFCILLLTSCATAPRSPIDPLLTAPPFQHSLWGIAVEDEQGRTLYAHDADKMFITASNRKLFAAATVADCIGFDARLLTELWIEGEDVILRGGGDPSLGAERHTREDALAPLVDALRQRGVTRVRDVIADVSLFDRVTVPGSWKWGNLASRFGAPVDALAWRENAAGEGAIREPALAAANALRDALILGGISVDGTVRISSEPHAWQERVAAVESPFVFQLFTTMLKNSHNLYAEMLFKRLSAGAAPASYDASAAIERRFLAEVGVPADETRFVDGSGLSPDDLATPRAIIRVLRWMNDPARRGVWWAVLATPGESGTLRVRLEELAPRLRGKTGTVAGVAALSGIIAGQHGGFRYFSILVNHHTVDSGDAEARIDAIVREIARF